MQRNTGPHPESAVPLQLAHHNGREREITATEHPPIPKGQNSAFPRCCAEGNASEPRSDRGNIVLTRITLTSPSGLSWPTSLLLATVREDEK